MNQQPTSTGQTGNWPEELDHYLYQFEQAWQSGNAPEIEQFLAGLEDQWKNWDQTTRSKLLEELIKLDLEFRWRQLHQAGGITADMAEQDTLVAGADESKRWFLEDYVRQHPQLGSSGKLPLELVLEEYRVRQLWGDSPNHQEYVKRFPDHGQDLPECLAQIDSDLPAQADTASSQQTASATIAAEPLASGRFGDYELLGEIARGGMGVVYRARQISLDRTVAVKMILSGQLASEEDVRRFRTEAESAARLQHPHIVTIHEVGELKGQHYFSMDFIEGENLSDRVSDGPLAPETAAELVSKVATAIDYAHQQGILHRDLKPQNILIDSSQEPQITDFGLAKRIEGGSELTGTGQILGTPSYLPPEQAGSDSSAVGPASDIYSLGAILYELVTDRPPFQAQTPLDTLMQVLSEEPVSPRLLNTSVPRDLETIILKCLQKQPSKRYASAAALSEELGRYLDGKPIAARPVGAWERGWRWCRRKPAVAGMWALAAVLLLSLSIGGPLVALQQSKNARQQAQLLERAQKAKTAEMRQRKEADRQKDIAETKRKEAEKQKGIAETKEQEADQATDDARRNLYRANIALAGNKLHERDFEAGRKVLAQMRPGQNQTDYRECEWYFLQSLLNPGTALVRPDTGRASCIAFGPRSDLVAIGYASGRLITWNPQTGASSQLDEHEGIVSNVEFSRDGSRLISVGWKSAKLWDVERGILLRKFEAKSPPVTAASISSDAKHIVTGTLDGQVVVWDSVSGKALFDVPRPIGFREFLDTGLLEIVHISFGPRGKWFGISHRSGATRLASVDKGVVQGVPLTKSVIFHPDGEHVFLDQGQAIVVWNLRDGKQVRRIKIGNVATLVVAPNGNAFAVARGDGSVEIYDFSTQESIVKWKAHAVAVSGIAFTTAGNRICTIDPSGTIKIWEIPSGAELLTLRGFEEQQGTPRSRARLAMTNDTALLASVKGGFLTLWDARAHDQRSLQRLNSLHQVRERTAAKPATRLDVQAQSLKSTIRIAEETSAIRDVNKQRSPNDASVYLLKEVSLEPRQRVFEAHHDGVLSFGAQGVRVDRRFMIDVHNMNGLKEIGLALHNFHNTFGMFPPAVVYGPDGKPWHSWRIFICPFLYDGALVFKKYRFDEPWDGPNNIKLIQGMPQAFQDAAAPNDKTRLVVITGEQTLFPAVGVQMTNRSEDPLAASRRSKNTATPGVRRISEVRDGTSYTIMVGRSHRTNAVPWTRPVDLEFEKVITSKDESRGFAAEYGRAQFLFVDGSVRSLGVDELEVKLKAFLSINGGEQLGQ